VPDLGTPLGLEESEETVGASVNVGTGQYNVARLDQAEDDVQRRHSRADGERTATGVKSGELRLYNDVPKESSVSDLRLL
jgi:hypothetical protein